jgi:hypothetical protein
MEIHFDQEVKLVWNQTLKTTLSRTRSQMAECQPEPL